MFSSLWVTHPAVMGFDFTLIAPLQPSHCGFSSVLGRGVSSLVKSRVFLSMIFQQPVVILVLSQEGVTSCPSILPSWTHLLGCICSGEHTCSKLYQYLNLLCYDRKVFIIILLPLILIISFLMASLLYFFLFSWWVVPEVVYLSCC